MKISYVYNEEKIALQYVYGELQEVKVPKHFRTNRTLQMQVIEFLKLYGDYKYYNSCLSTNNGDLIKYSKECLSDTYNKFNKYDCVFIKNYPEVFKTIANINL